MSTTAPPNPSRAGRTVVLIIVGAVVAAIIVWLSVAAVHAATRPDASGTWEIEDRFDSVVVDGDLADVDITYREVDRAELTLGQGGSGARLDLEHEVRGETLRVSLRHVREFGVFQAPWLWLGDRTPRLELVLPAALEREVTLALSTDAGDIHATGAFGDVTARSDIGDIELRGSVASLDVRTDAGDVDATDMSIGGDLTVQSVIGDVTLELESLPSGIDVETEAGELTVRLPEGRYAVSTETSLGDLELEVPNDPSATRRYDFASRIGDITIRN
ncbi:DUF4097 family beta strand repeat-containing protein [Agromyces sp. H66]|uniref:DUF4097 family beta strand repeat-containing protein n=1 Tax=Agromyces sp. H66 TaxID=2529859 RepID=UPI0010AAD359|nr:DUF4097 family beta strand repeat-containing protein [Agromyces sp. H66]